MDVKTRLPQWLDDMDESVKGICAKVFSRGSFNVSLEMEVENIKPDVEINTLLLETLVEKAQNVYRQKPEFFAKPSPAEFLRVGGVVRVIEGTPDEEERRRQYRLAVGIYLTCQGRLFFLSGEEAARTKGGLEDSYNASIEINRLDWERAWRERELVDYYRGLIALRKQLPGLCDKSPQAEGRIRTAWKRKGFAGFYVDNCRDGEESPWKTLCILYNRRKKPLRVPLEGDGWEALADGRDSFLWKKPEQVRKEAQVEAVSILVLGKREK